MQPLGPKIAEGRDSEIFDHGPGKVLRVARDGRSLVTEAEVMSYVRSHGYPVPDVYEAGEGYLVMDRIDGPTMLDDAIPFRIGRSAKLLAGLHEQLHSIPAPSWLVREAPLAGDRVVHRDLHPLNVLITADGPVVIDWANASRGDPAFDLADTWVLFSCADPPTNRIQALLTPVARRIFLRSFLRSVDREAARRAIPAAVAHRLADRNMSDKERRRMRTIAEWASRRPGHVGGSQPCDPGGVPDDPVLLTRIRRVRRRLAEAGPMRSRGDGDFERVSLPSDHCDVLRDVLVAEGARVVIEIGLAYGSSALAIGEALTLQQGARHVIIDAFQDHFDQAGWQAITEAGLDSMCTLLAERSQLALPRLASEGFVADAAFVDGSHIFHNVFVDLCFLRDVVRPGGMIVLDDCEWPSVATALRYFEVNTGWRPEPVGLPPRLRAFRLPDPRVEPRFEDFKPFGLD